MSEPIYTKHPDDGKPLFQGWSGCDCEHRTVGSHRAWCYDCAEWCYPRADAACARCRAVVVHGAVASETESQKLADIRERWLSHDLNDLDWLQAYDDVVYLLGLIQNLQHLTEE
jgi:hypothetical protein